MYRVTDYFFLSMLVTCSSVSTIIILKRINLDTFNIFDEILLVMVYIVCINLKAPKFVLCAFSSYIGAFTRNGNAHALDHSHGPAHTAKN